MADLAGRTLGQYQIIEEIGRGGMAVVYKAWQPSLNRHVAIKVLPPQLTFDTTFVQRFQQEASAAARLEHPNIVTIHDVGEEAGIRYIVMQLLEGQPLNELIQREGQMGLERVAGIMAQVASALDYAHEQGFVHRDVKPSNIIVGSDGQATLTDFGIAKAAEGTKLTRTGTVMGTAEYMSPEQAKGEAVSRATDVYSLGIVVYEMLAGRVPFKADSTPAILHMQAYERPQPVRAHAPQLPRGVDGVLAKALAKNPAERFSSAGELAGALQEVIEGKPFRYVEPEPPTIAAPTVGRKRTSWLMPVLGGAVVLALVAAAAFGLGSRGGRSTPSATVVAVVTETATPSPTAVPPTDTPLPTAAASPQETLTLTSVPTATVGPSPGKPQIVTGQAINGYSGPGDRYARAGRTAAGQTLNIVARNPEGTWWQVCCVGGEDVWIKAALVEVQGSADSVPVATVVPPTPTATPTRTRRPPTPTLEPAYAIVQGDKVNVREGPGTAYLTSGQVAKNMRLEIVGKNPDGDWWQLCCVDGQRAWIVGRLVTTEGDVGSVPVATNIPTPPAATATPAAVRLFEREEQGQDDVVMRRGSYEVNLTKNPARDYAAAWSPDSSKITFVSDRDGAVDIFVMDRDGSNPVNLTHHSAFDSAPAWSPDGRFIAFHSSRSGVYQIWVMGSDGSNARNLSQGGEHDYSPEWSPDGRQITFYRTIAGEGNNYEIMTMNADGSNKQRLTRQPGWDYFSHWTPDGSKIVFKSRREGGDADRFYVMNRDGSGLYRLSGSIQILDKGYSPWTTSVSQ
jgi:SH3-like domain-containing protein